MTNINKTAFFAENMYLSGVQMRKRGIRLIVSRGWLKGETGTQLIVSCYIKLPVNIPGAARWSPTGTLLQKTLVARAWMPRDVPPKDVESTAQLLRVQVPDLPLTVETTKALRTSKLR